MSGQMKIVLAIFFAASALCGVIGMCWGLQVSLSGDFILGAAHAHLNLSGFLTLAVYGSFYSGNADAAQTFLVRVHCVLAIVVISIFTLGVAMAVLGMGGSVSQIGGALLISSVLIFLGMAVSVLFLKRVYRESVNA